MSLFRRGAAWLAALVLSVCLAIALAFAGAAPASAHPHHGDHHGRHAMGWYLALGDSLAAGYQPLQGDARHGGYVGDVLKAVRHESGRTKLRNMACTGESTVTMLQGGRCSYHKGTQLAQAVQFLHAHARHTRLVTVSIGADDVQRCIDAANKTVDPVCVQQGLVDVAQNLPVILAKLRAVAPHTQIVVTNYYNPLLAAWVLLPGPEGQALAAFATGVIDQLNTIIAGNAALIGAEVADVSAAFSSHDSTPTTVPGLGEVPFNVAQICRLTWMCTPPPGPDTHPNDAGYDVIGSATIAALEQHCPAAHRRLALAG